jgi:hypothetical protein
MASTYLKIASIFGQFVRIEENASGRATSGERRCLRREDTSSCRALNSSARFTEETSRAPSTGLTR